MKTVLLSKWTNTLCACRSRAWIRAWNFEPQPYIIFVHNFPYQGFLPVWHHIFLSTLQFCLQGPFSYLSAVASILFTDGSHAVLVDVFELWTTTVQLVWPSPLRIKHDELFSTCWSYQGWASGSTCCAPYGPNQVIADSAGSVFTLQLMELIRQRRSSPSHP